MAGENRNQTDTLIASLRERTCDVHFYQAARRLECAFTERPRIGLSSLPSDDAVRFCQEAFLTFAPSSLSRLEGGEVLSLHVNFFGLLGPNGPMPLYFTEYIRNRIRDYSDSTLLAFVNLFNHRMIALLYRVWADCQKAVSYDRSDQDRFSDYLLSLVGMGRKAFQDRDLVPDAAKIYYSGRLGFSARNPEGLQAILEDYFRVRVRIEPFVGRWIELDRCYRNRIGLQRESGIVGQNLLLGSRYWDCQQTFRVCLGPLSLADYERLLPGEDSQNRLQAWLRNYLGEEYAVEVRLILKANEIPPLRLGGTNRLGFSTWIHSRSIQRDADQLTLRTFFN